MNIAEKHGMSMKSEGINLIYDFKIRYTTPLLCDAIVINCEASVHLAS